MGGGGEGGGEDSVHPKDKTKKDEEVGWGRHDYGEGGGGRKMKGGRDGRDGRESAVFFGSGIWRGQGQVGQGQT